MNATKQPLDKIGEQQLTAVFRQRAQQLASRGRQTAHKRSGLPVLVLRNADERFGIELAHVEQVFPRVELTPVPGAPHALIGVANLNGLPRSVFDFSQLLDLRSATSNARYIVLLSAKGRTLGLAVEGVEDVRRVDMDALLTIESANGSTQGFARGMTDDHVAVLDTEMLLQRILHQLEAQARQQNTLAGAAG